MRVTIKRGDMDLAAGGMALAPLRLREGMDLALLTSGAVMGETAPSQPREEPGDRLPVSGAVADTRAPMSREQSPGELAAQRRDDRRLPAFPLAEHR
jgi:hypothetical protein